jgi:hypothetical protein
MSTTDPLAEYIQVPQLAPGLQVWRRHVWVECGNGYDFGLNPETS